MLNSKNNNDKEECLKTLVKIYPGINISNLKDNIENQETLLKKDLWATCSDLHILLNSCFALPYYFSIKPLE